MAKGVEVSNNEQEFVLEALKQGIRLDGRSIDDFRDLSINLGDQYGYVEIKLGETHIIVRISAEITSPREDRPFEGLFHVSTEISPMASPIFENGRVNDDELLISRTVEKAVRRSGALDLESLCIIAGLKCWSVRADIHFLNYDGGFIDSSVLGVMIGLKHFKKNDLTVSGEQIIVHPVDEREPVELSILHIPICITFAIFNPTDIEQVIKNDLNDEIVITDPTFQELLFKDGELTITINKNREICQISKAGGLPINALTLLQLNTKSYGIVEKLTNRIKDVLDEDYRKRNEGVQYVLRAENDR